MRLPFDPARIVRFAFHTRNQHLAVEETQPLVAVVSRSALAPETPLLTMRRGAHTYAFQTRHFSLYNVLQGDLDGVAWMGTFCAICNAGMSFAPVVDGQRYTFYGVGYYDGMTLLADHQTGSYWDHLTGECLGGALVGRRLGEPENMLHTRAGQLAASQPDAHLVTTRLDLFKRLFNGTVETIRTADQPDVPAAIERAIATVEDTRLARYEMGLGVWGAGAPRFYPFRTIHAHDNLILDLWNGRRLLVYIDPDTLVPAALRTDAQTGAWRGDTLALDDGSRIRGGVLTVSGAATPMDMPLQLFQRWYGFALTFPGCDIYQSARTTDLLPVFELG